METIPMKKSSRYSKGRLSEVEIDALRERRMSQYEGKPAQMPLCIFNLMNAILGSGILGLANAAANLGILLFTAMLVSVAALAFNSITLLLEMCDYTGNSSYEAIGKAAFGVGGKIVTVLNIFIHTMGAMCSFLFIVKYELPEVIRVLVGADECEFHWYLNGDILVMIVTVVIIAPLAAARNIGFLGYTSGFAMACMIFFTGVIVAENWIIPCPIRLNHTSSSSDDVATMTEHQLNSTDFLVLSNFTGNETADFYGYDHRINSTFNDDYVYYDTLMPVPTSRNVTGGERDDVCASRTSDIFVEFEEALDTQTCDVKLATWNSKSAYAIPTMVFAFQCHASVLPIYTELSNPTQSRMKKVAVISILNVFALYFLSALFGYLTFYSAVGPELLLMYSAYDPSNAVILVSRIMVLICVIFSTPLLHYPARKALVELFFEGKPFSWFRHLTIMVILLSTTNILVVYVPTIREVFGFAGATCASMLVIILPSLYYVRLAPCSLSSPKKIMAMTLVLIGFGFMIFSIALIISGWISG